MKGSPKHWDEELNVLEEAKFDFEVAGAQFLGKDLARIVSPEPRTRIISILKLDEQLERLLLQILQTTVVGASVINCWSGWHKDLYDKRLHPSLTSPIREQVLLQKGDEDYSPTVDCGSA